MATLLRLASIGACAIVALGAVLFAVGEADDGARRQVGQVEGGRADAQSADHGRGRGEHGAVRRSVDDANNFLLAPFEGVTGSRNDWVRKLVPAALALLVYGFGLSLLANALPPPRPR